VLGTGRHEDRVPFAQRHLFALHVQHTRALEHAAVDLPAQPLHSARGAASAVLPVCWERRARGRSAPHFSFPCLKP
jgi:hypothetical protein